MKREKIFVNHISNRRLVPRMYKGLSKLDSKETNNPIGIWAKDMKRHFTEGDMQMTNKRYLTSLAIREIQIKTTRRGAPGWLRS